MRPTAALGLAALLAAWLGCTDKGVVGEMPAPVRCEPACAADERCERGTCVACGDDCAPPPSPPADAGGCDGAACTSCNDDDQCESDAPMCVDGRCSQCEEDDDCDGEGERACEDGRCVEVDEDHEASSGDDGSGDDDELPDDS